MYNRPNVNEFTKVDEAKFRINSIDVQSSTEVGRPYDTTWNNGKEVTVYPDGTVIERITGRMIQRGSNSLYHSQIHNLEIQNRNTAPAEKWVNGETTLTALNTNTVFGGNIPIRKIYIRTSSSNSAAVLIGSSNMDSTNASMSLGIGRELILKVSNLNMLYFRGAIGDQISYTYEI